MRRPLLAIVCVAASALIIDAQDARSTTWAPRGDASCNACRRRRACSTRARTRTTRTRVHRQGGARRHARVGVCLAQSRRGRPDIIGPELFDRSASSAPRNCSRRDGSTARNSTSATPSITAFEIARGSRRRVGRARHARRLRARHRLFRPLVVYSRFSGTPADGHGHHQEGRLSPTPMRRPSNRRQRIRRPSRAVARACAR